MEIVSKHRCEIMTQRHCVIRFKAIVVISQVLSECYSALCGLREMIAFVKEGGGGEKA